MTSNFSRFIKDFSISAMLTNNSRLLYSMNILMS